MKDQTQAKFFAKGDTFRAWLEKHSDVSPELLVGFYKRGSGRPSITWPEAVDAALCFGWIDGVRKSIDSATYAIRFTPRRLGSLWSAKNVTRAQELSRLGLMHPAGLRAFEEGAKSAPGRYSYEQDDRDVKLDPAYQRQLRANRRAWKFFQDQPAWYRKAAIWWIMSAKKEETKLKRLATLIQDSENGKTIRPLARPKIRAAQAQNSTPGAGGRTAGGRLRWG